MSESAGKRRKRYVDYPRVKSKTYHIYGPGNLSDEFKVLVDFGYKYVNCRPTKVCGHDPVPIKIFNRKKENNSSVKSAVDEILLHKNQKLSAEKEAHEKFESDFDENELYQIDNMSLDDTKKNINDVSVCLNANLKIHMGLKIRMV